MKTGTESIEAIDHLLRARIQRKPINSIPEHLRPCDIAQAYKLQELLVEQLMLQEDAKTIGYKVACTNKLAQDLVKVKEPFYGRMMSHSSFKDGVEIDSNQFFFRCVEAEFSFEIASDVPARPITADDLGDYIGAIVPSVEIVDSRFADWLKIDALSHIVDNACHGAWVQGKHCEEWRNNDLAEQSVKLFVNGQLAREGSGRAVLGHPLNVVAWLANTLLNNGRQLKSGEFVSTGITTDVYFASPGDKIVADFGNIGQVELSFSS